LQRRGTEKRLRSTWLYNNVTCPQLIVPLVVVDVVDVVDADELDLEALDHVRLG
jgi:hypothetical protein